MTVYAERVIAGRGWPRLGVHLSHGSRQPAQVRARAWLHPEDARQQRDGASVTGTAVLPASCGLWTLYAPEPTGAARGSGPYIVLDSYSKSGVWILDGAQSVLSGWM